MAATLLRAASGEHLVAGLGDGHIVLDADADAFPAIVDLRLPLRHAEAVTDVKARFHREHHAWLQRAGCSPSR